MVMKWSVLLAGTLALLSLVARAQRPEFVIRQVSGHLPNITAYLDVPAENGKPPQLGVSDISAVTIQGQNLKFENVSVTHGFAYILLLDVSGSMRIRQDVLKAIGNWIDRLRPDDHLEMFAFGETYREVGTPTSDKATLKSELKKLRSGEQTTNLYYALVRGIANAERTDNTLSAGRMIVLLTDGKNEGNYGGVDEAKVHDEIRKGHVPIFAIGHTRLSPHEDDIYLGKMKSFADESGGVYECAGTVRSALCPPNASLEQSFEQLSARMDRMFVLQLTCDRCRESDNHDLQITLKNGLAARITVALTLLQEAAPVPKPTSIWVYVAGVLLLVIVLFVVWLAFKKNPAPPIPPEPPEPVDAPPQESGSPARITIVSGPEPGRVYQFKIGAKAVIGRDAGCAVTLTGDQEVSGQHCELTRNGKWVEIADLGSMNGTLLNGALLVARQRIEDGDLVRAGRTEFRVRFGESG
jgi:hypothetical protein